jgi:hypothetical protein
MKAISISVFALLLPFLASSQVSGNLNYQNQNAYQHQMVQYPEKNIDITYPSNANLYITVKGLANIKADSYVAIFSITQVGKTIEEVNTLLETRISQALEAFKTKPGVETFVDMISFVPVYEYQSDKKIFSKKTYNEVPAGFELKKNIHIKYADQNLLNDIITTFSKYEIYDLVKVDYYSTKMEATKKELMTRAKSILSEKLKYSQSIVSAKADTAEKQMMDGFKVVLPSEMYRSYQAYYCSSLNLYKQGNVNQADKTMTMYYQPVSDKEFDFVINPVILEPVIQVMYELNVVVNREKNNKPEKEFIFITPNGEMKNLNLKK